MANSFVGHVHLISSALALIFGTFVLISKKGSKRHKQAGYLYVMSMLVLLVTAFAIYRLFNSWGMFHYMAFVSLASIALGMIPVWTKKPLNKWKYMHFSFMYWSVIGLYCAFAAELLTRVPKSPFFWNGWNGNRYNFNDWFWFFYE